MANILETNPQFNVWSKNVNQLSDYLSFAILIDAIIESEQKFRFLKYHHQNSG